MCHFSARLKNFKSHNMGKKQPSFKAKDCKWLQCGPICLTYYQGGEVRAITASKYNYINNSVGTIFTKTIQSLKKFKLKDLAEQSVVWQR